MYAVPAHERWGGRGQGRLNVAEYAVLDGPDGKVWGLWFRSQPDQYILRMVAVELSEEVYREVYQQHYRIVPNTFDDKGGFWVMLGSRLAPGEKY